MDQVTTQEVDIWRDTPVRLLGYANEVGEAFRALIHKNFVRMSYGVAFAYVLADTEDKTRKAAAKGENKMIAGADTLVWQTLASVAIPGATINRCCALSLFLLKKNQRLSMPAKKWITTAIGLSLIPFIVKPIDHFVDYLMDNTFRPYFGKETQKVSQE